MTVYRVYEVRREAHSCPPVVFECAADCQAIDRAKQMQDGYAVEVWEGTRRVAELKRPQASDAIESRGFSD